MIKPGTVLLGKYRIERELGQGGMGVVALAHHIQLDQPVAIKFLQPDVLDNATVVQRFLREAQAAVKLRSEHVCQVYDVGTLETGSPYMVMEYLDGVDLGGFLSRQGPPAAGLAVDFMLQACDALAEAHALGIVHRDIKPGNFFLTHRADGSPLIKVLDFGISKAPVALSDELTKTQNVLGTPAYMSPEQMRSSKNVDARSDIWSLGVVLYQMLSGHRPFRADTFSEMCVKVAMDPVPPIPVALPPGLDHVVLRCLERDLDRRYQNIAELVAALAPFAQSRTLAASTLERTARTLGLAAVPPVHTAGPPTGDIGRPPSTISATAGQVSMSGTHHPPAGRRTGVIAAVATITALAAAIVVLLVGGTDSGDTPVNPDDPAAAGDVTATPEGGALPGQRPAAQPTATPDPQQPEPTADPTAVPPGQEPDAMVAAADDSDTDEDDGDEGDADPDDADQDDARRTARTSRDRDRRRSSARATRKKNRDEERKRKTPRGDDSSGEDDILGTRH